AKRGSNTFRLSGSKGVKSTADPPVGGANGKGLGMVAGANGVPPTTTVVELTVVKGFANAGEPPTLPIPEVLRENGGANKFWSASSSSVRLKYIPKPPRMLVFPGPPVNLLFGLHAKPIRGPKSLYL